MHELERDREGRITSVIYRHGGIDHRQRCAAVYLCAGAVETPRLLLHLGLANGSGQVGRNYMGHVATQVWGTFEAEMRMNRGYPSSLISEDMVRPNDADFAGGYLMQSLGVLPVTWGNSVARGRGLWGRALTEHLNRYNHMAGIGINGETLPCDANVLVLADEVDAFGMRKAADRFRLFLQRGSAERPCDADHEGDLGSPPAPPTSGCWSASRTRSAPGRMGMDGDSAVVDPHGRSFEIPNLWISDGSTFPSSLAANPALTIMALALRSAEAFLGHPS